MTQNGSEPDRRERDYLRARLGQTIDGYDRVLLTLSGGSLSLSVVLAERLAKSPPVKVCVLVGSWVALILSLVLLLTTYVMTAMSLQHRLKSGSAERTFMGGPVAFYLSVTAGVLFVVGVSGLAWFAVANLG